MMFDKAGARPDDALVEPDRRRDGRRQRADLREIARPIGDRAGRAVPQEEERLAPQMRPRIARHGEQIDVGRLRARHPQTLRDRAMRESGAVLDAAEALLFHGGDQPAVPYDRGRHVAVIGVQAEDEAVRHQ